MLQMCNLCPSWSLKYGKDWLELCEAFAWSPSKTDAMPMPLLLCSGNICLPKKAAAHYSQSCGNISISEISRAKIRHFLIFLTNSRRTRMIWSVRQWREEMVLSICTLKWGSFWKSGFGKLVQHQKGDCVCLPNCRGRACYSPKTWSWKSQLWKR